MGNYAKVVDGKVINIIVANEDYINQIEKDKNELYVETIIDPTVKNDKFNPAAIGGYYDIDNNAFYDPQPYPSWKLDKTDWTWKSPTKLPEHDRTKVRYGWDEAKQEWYIIRRLYNEHN